jgi:hypothetical protein
MAMASILPASRYQSESALRKLRRLLGWQSLGFDGRVRCGAVPLGGLRSSEFIFFSSYALSDLVLPFSSFFMMLETYDLQLHLLSSPSIMLVVIFIHLYEMYMGVRSLVRLFQLFHVVEVVLRHFHRHCHKSSLLWFFVGDGLSLSDASYG